MEFTKIKYNGTQVELHIKANTSLPEDKEERVFTSKDAPMPSFQKCFDDLKIHVEEICELPEGYMTDSKIHTVNISYQDSGNTAIISCTKTLETVGRAFNFNTPSLPVTSETDSDSVMPEDCAEIIDSLLAEAKSFYNGNRMKEPTIFDDLAKQGA